MSRIVCQFSCGAASAVATKLMLMEKYPYPPLIIVNAFLMEEHADNRRFLADCERWFAHPVLVLRDEVYGASTDEVWRRKRYIKGPRGAPCSLELKRKLLAKISDPGDLNVIGYTVEEVDRFDELRERSAQIWQHGRRRKLLMLVLLRNGYAGYQCMTSDLIEKAREG